MSAGWVAGCVRARALARRRLGPAVARQLAASPSLADALQVLAATPYGRRNQLGQALPAAQHAIAGTVLWDLRVLAGWLPREGVQLLRTLAGWFELANTDELLAAMDGRPAAPEFRLGALATTWPRLRAAASPAGLRAALAASPWRDPGGDTTLAIRLGMRARWAAQIASLGEPARAWATGAAVLLIAGERFAAGRQLDPALTQVARQLLGPAAASAPTLEGLASSLPPHARWPLAGVGSPAELWRGERSWWARIERDGGTLLAKSGAGSGIVLGAVAMMSADARRVSAALEIAARGGGPLEAYDAVA